MCVSKGNRREGGIPAAFAQAASAGPEVERWTSPATNEGRDQPRTKKALQHDVQTNAVQPVVHRCPNQAFKPSARRDYRARRNGVTEA